jgi:putative ABC transport system substrate-binding protein
MRLRLPNVLVLGAFLLTASGWWVDAQGQTRLSRVGILTIEPPGDAHKQAYGAFYRTLMAHGWVEGKDVEFAYARADGDSSRFAEAAGELVALRVDVIFADSAPAVRAAFAATRTIPIVAGDFTNDPIAEGYAESYRRPGKNVTGVFLDAPEFSAKWLEMLKAVVPGLSRAVALWDPSPGDAHLRALQAAARSFGIQLQIVEVRTPQEIDKAASVFRGRPQALIVLPSPMTWRESARLAKLTMKERLPSTSFARPFAATGGLLVYGPNGDSVDERCGVLVAKVLSGATPAELPIERPTKFELIVNLKAAKALNLTIPESVLSRADEVIR